MDERNAGPNAIQRRKEKTRKNEGTQFTVGSKLNKVKLMNM